MRVVPTRLGHRKAASLCRSRCGQGAYHFDAAGAAGCRQRRCFAGVTMASVRTAAAAAVSASPFPLSTARRTYYWPHPENLVPEGESTSLFQSSPVPSVRERIVREYALSPLFGGRTPCCVLGFSDTARDVLGRKARVRQWVAQILGKDEADVELGALLQTKEMMLHRSGTDESPRVADGDGSRPDAELRRVTRYARLPVQARTLLEVYLPEEEQPELGSSADTDAALRAYGYFLQEQLHRYMTATATSAPGSDSQREIRGSGCAEVVDEMQSRNGVDNEYDDEEDVRQSVAALHDECGVIYCEVPALDESDYVFDRLYGKEVDNETTERVMNSWTRRVTQRQQEQS
ncbi:hypothetical protein JKF63_05564 [Porcisia hertigi]|uniref:Uncharacterized protein n=1 Tax=Porcisia hertigi TaxID=2761500 RepID=A0A836ITT7_9TRYP|nr:hypothetical protein JKF63_05564 [Porcisia hertigi]